MSKRQRKSNDMDIRTKLFHRKLSNRCKKMVKAHDNSVFKQIIGEFEKGNSIIVGKRKKSKKQIIKDYYLIDGVLVYDAYCLSSSVPHLLQGMTKSISLNDGEPIYLCGHGNGKKQTISEYTMEELAGLLATHCNMTNISKMYIMSCHGKHKNKSGDDMASLLKAELLKLGIDLDIESVCENTTIVVDYFNKALVADKKYNTVYFTIQQSKYQKRFLCDKYNVHKNNFRDWFEFSFNEVGKDIAVHNYALLSKGGSNKMERFEIKLVILLILCALCIFIAICAACFKWSLTILLVSLVIVFIVVIAGLIYTLKG